LEADLSRRCRNCFKSESSPAASSKFCNSKLSLMGVGSSVIINLMTVASLTILATAKDSGVRSYESLNQALIYQN
jgi:hypothetical protein